MKRRKDSLNSLVTKSYLKSELKRGLGALETRVDLKLDSLRIEIDENARKYRDEILNEFDKFAKELRDAHEERIIAAHQVAELRKRANNHQERIKKLEDKAS